MKVALVHDYLREYGGAERVLKVLSEMYPEAPIYTAFLVKNSIAGREFEGRKVIESKWAPLLKLGKLYSPLRFLAPKIWRDMDLSDFDLVISSASWYLTKGFNVGPKTKVVCYCHTPPRYLYGLETSIDWRKFWPVRLYALVVNHYLRLFDFKEAQKIDQFIANSENVKKRIAKFYRRDSVVIYPPIEVEKIREATVGIKKEDYFLIVSRLVGAKGIEEAVRAAKEGKYHLKISGESAGLSNIAERIKKIGGKYVEMLGRVGDEELYKLYAGAVGFIALARDEDFGMTVVEAQAAGTPVLAFRGGGFLETVIENTTGVFVDKLETSEIVMAMKKIKTTKWNRNKIYENAKRFSKDDFVDGVRKVVNTVLRRG